MSANDLIEIPTIRKIIPNLMNKKILELGCDFVENCEFFLNKGASYVLGTDISENMIKIAKENVKNKKCEFIVLLAEDILEINDKFDVVISFLVVHYVEDFEKLLNDIYSLLNENDFIFSLEHPIGTGTILNDVCKGKDNIYLGDKYYHLVSDYNLNGERVVDWNNCSVIKYHRNFSCIINIIIKCNFEIEEILEPIPDKEMLKKT